MKRPLRILHVVHTFPPESYGGTEINLLSLAKAQRDRGLEPVIFTGTEGERAARTGVEVDAHEGFPVYRLRPRPPEHYSLDTRDFPAAELLVRTVGEIAPDLVHVHHWHNITTHLVDTLRGLGLPVGVMLHDFYVTCPLFFRQPGLGVCCEPDIIGDRCARCLTDRLPDPVEALQAAVSERETLMRRELLVASGVSVISDFMAGFLHEHPLFGDIDFEVIPLPLFRPQTGGTLREVSRSEFDLRLVTWGGLVPGKGYHTLVQAVEALPEGVRVSIDHYGRVLDHAYRDHLVSLARRCVLTLHGKFDAGEQYELMGGYDLAVFPSLFMETHGLVVDEALAMGLPVLVSDRGAPRERIGARGLTFPAGDGDALAKVLQELVGTPGRLAEMRAGEPARAVTVQEHCASLEAWYRRLIAAGANR